MPGEIAGLTRALWRRNGRLASRPSTSGSAQNSVELRGAHRANALGHLGALVAHVNFARGLALGFALDAVELATPCFRHLGLLDGFGLASHNLGEALESSAEKCRAISAESNWPIRGRAPAWACLPLRTPAGRSIRGQRRPGNWRRSTVSAGLFSTPVDNDGDNLWGSPRVHVEDRWRTGGHPDRTRQRCPASPARIP